MCLLSNQLSKSSRLCSNFGEEHRLFTCTVELKRLHVKPFYCTNHVITSVIWTSKYYARNHPNNSNCPTMNLRVKPCPEVSGRTIQITLTEFVSIHDILDKSHVDPFILKRILQMCYNTDTLLPGPVDACQCLGTCLDELSY